MATTICFPKRYQNPFSPKKNDGLLSLLAFPKNHDDNLLFPERCLFMSKFPLTSLVCLYTIVYKLSTKIAHLQIRVTFGHDPIIPFSSRLMIMYSLWSKV